MYVLFKLFNIMYLLVVVNKIHYINKVFNQSSIKDQPTMTQTKVKSIGSVTIKSPNVYELVMTTLERIESEYVLNELVRNKANAKKVMNIGLEYGDISQALTTVEFIEFYWFYDVIVSDMSVYPSDAKKAYKELVKTSEFFN